MKKVKVKRKRKVNKLSLLKAQIVHLEGIIEGLAAKIAQLDSATRFVPFSVSRPLKFGATMGSDHTAPCNSGCTCDTAKGSI